MQVGLDRQAAYVQRVLLIDDVITMYSRDLTSTPSNISAGGVEVRSRRYIGPQHVTARGEGGRGGLGREGRRDSRRGSLVVLFQSRCMMVEYSMN